MIFRWTGANRLGLRRQSGSGDGALGRTGTGIDADDLRAGESGVALRWPPPSKTRWRAGRARRPLRAGEVNQKGSVSGGAAVRGLTALPAWDRI
jgi:hypothetical protein